MMCCFITMIILYSCEQRTDAENQFIKDLTKQYGDNYTFDTAVESFLLVHAKHKIKHEDIIKIRMSFVGKFPEIRWAYVNAYDSTGVFLYQLAYDSYNKTTVKSYKEFDI